MRLRDLYRINSRKALLVSVFVHLLILTGLISATLQLTTPEGQVLDGEFEMAAPGSGEPIPIEVAPAVPKGLPEVKEKLPDVKEEVVEVPKPIKEPPPEKPIEKQKVEAVAKPVPQAKPKTWTPVEETDIAKDEHGVPAKTETESESETESAAATGTASDSSPTPPPQASAGSEDGDAEEESPAQGSNVEGEGLGPVRSASELTEQSGNPRVYPYLARVQRIQGVAIVRFILNSNGEVAKIWLHKSSGSKLLDQSALETLAKWKWNYVAGADGVFEKRMVYVLSGPAEQAPYRKK